MKIKKLEVRNMNSISKYLFLVFMTMILSSCFIPELNLHKRGKIKTSRFFCFRHSTVIHVVPNGQTVQVDWKGYNQSGSSIPFEMLKISQGSEKYTITSRNARNNQLFVNEKAYNFDALNKHLHVEFGKGVSIKDKADCKSSLKLKSVNF